MKGITNLASFIAIWFLLILVTLGLGLLLLIPYWLLVFKDDQARIQKARDKLQSILMAHEKMIDSCMQMRLFALFNRRQLIAITSSRVILINRSIFGGFTMRDYQWKDLHDAKLSENTLPNISGSRIEFQLNKNTQPMLIDGIPSVDASKIYAYAQAQEQEWEEKLRIRNLEEKRAVSGGMTIASAGGASGGASSFDDLEKAKKLFDSGAISDSEYQEIKSKILGRGNF